MGCLTIFQKAIFSLKLIAQKLGKFNMSNLYQNQAMILIVSYRYQFNSLKKSNRTEEKSAKVWDVSRFFKKAKFSPENNNAKLRKNQPDIFICNSSYDIGLSIAINSVK